MPTKKPTTTSVTGQRLKEAREAAGLRLDDAATYAREILGSGPSRETIRRYETTITPEDQMDPMIVAALASVYNVDLAWISPIMANRISSWAEGVGLLPATAGYDEGRPPPPPRPRQWRTQPARRPITRRNPQSAWTGDGARHGSKEKTHQARAA